MMSLAFQNAAVQFLSFPRVCEIKNSHIGKNSGNFAVWKINYQRFLKEMLTYLSFMTLWIVVKVGQLDLGICTTDKDLPGDPVKHALAQQYHRRDEELR